MFDIDRWQEIFDAIRKNKLRTFLTGLSVASGIFILVILLGFGQGFQNGIRNEFEADATSRVWVWTNPTSKEFKGLNPGRSIWLKNENIEYADEALTDYLETSSGVSRVRATINYKSESGSYGVQGISPDYQEIENLSMTMGRFINQADMAANNKVVVISNKVYRELLDKNDDPLNEYLKLSQFNFKIVGVYIDNGGEREENRVYIPRTTAQTVFNGQNRVNNIAFTLKEDADFDAAVGRSKEFVQDYETYLKQVHTVAPDDESAINVYSALEEAKRYYTLASNIALFFWFVGVCTIIAGVVGVSNIMLIVVKERTREIGIRKALGAQPWSVVGMILHESIFVTAIAGFTGLIFSMGLFELAGPHIEVDYIVNPSVNFNTALTMVLVLIFAGALAGFFPAWRAARIQPIVALRDE